MLFQCLNTLKFLYQDLLLSVLNDASCRKWGYPNFLTLCDILGIKLFERDMLFLSTSLEEPTLFQCLNTLKLLYQDLLLFVLNDASCRKWGYPNFYSLWYPWNKTFHKRYAFLEYVIGKNLRCFNIEISSYIIETKMLFVMLFLMMLLDEKMMHHVFSLDYVIGD